MEWFVCDGVAGVKLLEVKNGENEQIDSIE